MTNNKKVAVAYVRMSSDIQLEGHSLERQDTLATEYAKRHNIEIIEVLHDIGKSGFSGEHIKSGDFGRYLERIETGDIDNNSLLLVESVDRLSRQAPRTAFNQFNKIIDYGIEVHTLFDGQVYSSDSVDGNQGQLFQLLGYMLRAHGESKEKSRRLKLRWASNRENVKNGRILTTICPAWLKAKEDKTGFIKIDDRVKTVKKIFDLSIDENMGMAQITSYLNIHEDKHPRFTKPHKNNRLKNGKTRTGWQKSYVTKILNNKAVYGEFQAHKKDENGKRIKSGEPVYNYFPAIISEDRFIEAQAVKRSRQSGGGGRKGAFKNIFTKLLRCGSCGARLNFVDKGKQPKGGQYLQCYNSLTKYGNCKSPAWRYSDFEDNFFTYITEVELKPILSKVGDKTKKQKLISSKKVIDEKIIKQKIQLNNLAKMYSLLSDDAMSNLSDEFENASIILDALKVESNNLSIELAQLKKRTSFKTQTKIIEAIKNLSEDSTEEKQIEIRRRINKQIGDIIEVINIHNTTGHMYPWEVTDMLSSGIRRELEKEGIISDEDIEALFSNSHADRIFNKMERHFTVKFRNGELKTVRPYLRTAYVIKVNEQVKRFIRNTKKREAEQALKARRKATQ